MAQTTAAGRRALRSQEQRRYPLWRLFRANLYDLGLLARQSSLVLIGFALVVVTGTLYFRFFYVPQLSTHLALYQAVKLLLFASDEKLPADVPGQVLFFVAPLLGLALLAQGVLNFGRLVLDKSTRREAWQVALASTYRRHVIVCGLGHVGLRVVTHLLEAGYEAVVVERDWSSEYVARALNLKTPVVPGDARELTTLRQASLKHARAVVACVNNDLVNIEIALAARAGHADIQTILRIFSEELDRNLEHSFGANTAFSTSALAAPTLAAASVSHQIDYVLTLDSTDLLGVSHLTLAADTPFAGPLWKFEESEGVRVLAHQDAAGRMSGNLAMQDLKAGDRLTLLGPLAMLETLHLKLVNNAETARLASGRARHSSELLDRVVVCGLGKTGYRIVQRLSHLTPRPEITVIHLDDGENSFSRQISGLEGVKTVIGDARDGATLQRAGVEHATTIAAVTADDLVNLQIGLAARHAHPHLHLVLRVFSDALAVKLGDLFHISTTYSTSELAGSTLAAAAILSGVGQAFFVGEELLATDLHTVKADSRLAGKAIQTIRAEEQALVIALRRQGAGEGASAGLPQATAAGAAVMLPPLETVIAPGDEVTLLAGLDTLARLRGI